jgi:flotillin
MFHTILADSSPLYIGGGVLAFLVALAFLTLLIVLKRNYKRCSSNQILVIFGRTTKGEAAKTVHGGAAFVWPLIQDYSYLSLEPIQIEIPLRGALSMENIRVNVPSVFTVAIGTQPDVMTNAAIRLLDLSTDDIRKQAEEIIFGQLRQVIASMRIEDINRDRDTFLQHIQNSVEPELKKIGLVLINVNITDIQDESGYIDAIGQKAASQAIQQARADVADEVKQGEIRVAGAERDKVVQVASATKEREIGTREAAREQAVRVAELEKEQTVGEQTAAFQRDISVK